MKRFKGLRQHWLMNTVGVVFVLGIVYIHRYIFKLGKITGCANCIQKIYLKIGMIFRLVVEALGADL